MKGGGIVKLCKRHVIKTRAGFTLIELIITIALIGIVTSIATFGFRDFQSKSRVEAQVRQIASDIGELRIRAITMKQRHNIVLNESSYLFQSYSTYDLPKCSGGSPGGVPVPGKNITVSYKLKKANGSYYSGSCSNTAGDTFEIDQRGMLVGNGATVFIDYPGNAASVDCLTIHTVRVNVGKNNGVTCDDK